MATTSRYAEENETTTPMKTAPASYAEKVARPITCTAVDGRTSLNGALRNDDNLVVYILDMYIRLKTLIAVT